jgi:DNA-binding HxlR family transcriptional regulator
MLTKEELPECPVATTVQLIGNKWKLLIIRNLLTGSQRFGEFLKTIPGISKKVLTDNLRALEEDGIIYREVFAEVPPKVVYTLTEVGESLRPVLDAMREWGTEYKSQI